jgi:hypothetical protein
MHMARTTYHVTLSLNGDHRVSVTSDDPTELSESVAWAKGIVLKLEAYAREHAEEEQVEEEPPTCEVHQLPMVKVQGRTGEFWSCHERMPDGSWCSYKPPAQ